jgi:preprotein translocase subunit SecE
MPADKTIGEQEEGRRRRRVRAAVAEPEAQEQDRAITVGKGRPTPSRRRQEEAEEDSGNIATRTVGGLREYVEGVRSELQKVAWPTREETRRLTIIVLITLLVSAIILGAISLFFTELFRIGFNQPAILIGFIVVAVAAGIIFWRVNRGRSTSY